MNTIFKPYLLKSLVLVVLLIRMEGIQSNEFLNNKLIKQVEDICQEAKVSAALVLIVTPNKTILNQTYGTTNWQNEIKFNTTHRFRVGSISKSFAGLLALRMQQKGIIDLNDRLDKYLSTAIIENKYKQHPITLAQLLEHSAGVSDLSKAEWDFNDSKPFTLEQALALKKGHHVTLWPAGLHSSYSNVGVAYLALALEKASNIAYEDLMDEYVFKPLAMNSSNFFLTEEVKQNLIAGYDTDGTSPIPYWHTIYRPFAGINTNAEDMVAFLQMLLNQGSHKADEFLSPIDINRFESPKTTMSATNGLTYGYGLGNYQWQTQGHSFHGHGGDADGYLTKYAYQKDTGMAYFIMINAFQQHTLKTIQNLVESYIIKDLPKPNYPKRLKLMTELLKSYVGKYQQITQRFGSLSSSRSNLEIYIEDNQLYLKTKGNSSRVLLAVDQQNFRFSNESVATIAFVNYENELYLQGDFGNFKRITP